MTDPLNAYQLSKRGNSLRVKVEAVRWGKRGARVNTISPGIIDQRRSPTKSCPARAVKATAGCSNFRRPAAPVRRTKSAR